MKLICGNCLEIMKYIPNESIDMILCDLPYGSTKNKFDIRIDLSSLLFLLTSFFNPASMFLFKNKH